MVVAVITEIVRAQAEYLFEQMRTAKAAAAAQNVVELNEKSQFLKALKDKGVEIDPEQEKLFTASNDPGVITKFHETESV